MPLGAWRTHPPTHGLAGDTGACSRAALWAGGFREGRSNLRHLVNGVELGVYEIRDRVLVTVAHPRCTLSRGLACLKVTIYFARIGIGTQTRPIIPRQGHALEDVFVLD